MNLRNDEAFEGSPAPEARNEKLAYANEKQEKTDVPKRGAGGNLEIVGLKRLLVPGKTLAWQIF